MMGMIVLTDRSKHATHLTQGDDEATRRLFLAGEADVVGGNEHLSQDVHLVKGGPQGAVRVSVQFLIFGQTEKRAVSLALGSRIQIPKGWKMHFSFFVRHERKKHNNNHTNTDFNSCLSPYTRKNPYYQLLCQDINMRSTACHKPFIINELPRRLQLTS